MFRFQKKENLKRHIQKHLNRKDLPQEIMQMLQLFMNEFGDRFKNDDTNEIMAQATILDPRFKQLGFSNRSKYEAARTQLKSKICSILVATLNLIEQNEDTLPRLQPAHHLCGQSLTSKWKNKKLCQTRLLLE
jgi:hypothetical protein